MKRVYQWIIKSDLNIPGDISDVNNMSVLIGVERGLSWQSI